MSALAEEVVTPRGDTEGLTGFLRRELRPVGRWLTPFNVITMAIMAASAVILCIRFVYGLGAVTNLNQTFPWGIWKGFNVITGVAFAGGAYVLCFMVYIMRIEKYHPIVRVTVLNGFLAYTFYAGALILELGRPWNIMNPIIGNAFGYTSVLFLIAWHFLLYMIAQLVEFSPAIAEWLGARRLHRVLTGMTIGAVVFGITLSTLHQSALAGLFLMAESKVHPLWYTEFIPILFFVSSIFAGLTMVVFQGGFMERVFQHRMSAELKAKNEEITYGLARVSGGAMYVYLFVVATAFIHGAKWEHLQGGWGLWWVTEIVGFTAIPAVLLLTGSNTRSMGAVRLGAVLTIVGVVLNRLNISIIAFRWNAPDHYVPTWMEVVVAMGVISVQLWVFRWIIERMPVLGDPPKWARHDHQQATWPATLPGRGAGLH